MTFSQSPHGILVPGVETALKKGVDFLFENQQENGSWKSEDYGNLKQGAAITSLVLFSLSYCNAELILSRKKQVKQAFDFLRLGINKHGYVANVDGPDYSNYSTALTILAVENFKSRWNWDFLSLKEQEALVQFLVNSQLDETHELRSSNVDFGGWDLSGWMQGPRSSPGTNISVSSFVLLALKGAKSTTANAARDKANKWIQRLRNKDHGFHFHPQKKHQGNKAPGENRNRDQPGSYGTATIDGVRAMRCLGYPEQEWAKSVGWLEKYWADPKLEFVPGFQLPPRNASAPDVNASWGKGLLFYYLMSVSLEKKSLSGSFRISCQQQVPAVLARLQLENGSWKNNSARMREDDPMIATPFAIIALSQFTEKRPR